MKAPRRHATTVAELVVAGAVSALVITGVYMLLSFLLRDSNRVGKQVSLARVMVAAIDQLQHDLRRAVDLRRLEDGYLLTVRAEHARAPGEPGPGGFQQVTYRTRGPVLERRTSPPGTLEELPVPVEDPAAGPGPSGSGTPGGFAGVLGEPGASPEPALVGSSPESGTWDRQGWDFAQEGGVAGDAELEVGARPTSRGDLAVWFRLGSAGAPDQRVEGESLPLEEDARRRGEGDADTAGIPGDGGEVPGDAGSGEFSAAPTRPAIQGQPVPGRPPRSLPGAWADFVGGGDEGPVDLDGGLFRGRTNVTGPAGAPPRIFRVGDPQAELPGPGPLPSMTGDPAMDAVIAASGDDEGILVVEVPGGFRPEGAPPEGLSDVLVVVSDGAAGAAGGSPPLPVSDGEPGGTLAGQPVGEGFPGGGLPGDGPGGPGPFDPGAPPEQAEYPPAPPPLSPPGTTSGLPPPPPAAAATSDLPTAAERGLLSGLLGFVTGTVGELVGLLGP